jgi:hypothetical protein
MDQQTSYIQKIDERASTIFAIGSTVLPIVTGVFATQNNTIADNEIAKLALFVGFVAYVAMAGCFGLSLRYGKWQDAPDMEEWKEISTRYAVEDLQRALGNAYADAYSASEPKIELMARYASCALWLLLVEALALSSTVQMPMWPPIEGGHILKFGSF